jgi:hypothetical protein
MATAGTSAIITIFLEKASKNMKNDNIRINSIDTP